MIQGIDYYSGNGNPHLSGLDFAIRKITEGTTYVDPGWRESHDYIVANNCVFGAYHFFHGNDNWQGQADWFLSHYTPSPGEFIALDYESGYDTTGKNSWLAYVKNHHPNTKVGLYCDLDYWHNTDDNCGDFLWIADYTTAGQPRVQHSWTFHQYSDSNGSLDLDVANFATKADLQTWTGTPQLVRNNNVFGYFSINANQTLYLPLEPAGTTAQPQGAAKNGSGWVILLGQDTGTVTVSLNSAGTPQSHAVQSSSKTIITLPTDGSGDHLKLDSDVPVMGYVVYE